MSDRKRHEAEFHDRMRAVYEANPEQYAEFLTNKKFYSITRSSREYVQSWLLDNCAGKTVLDFGCGGGGLSFLVAPIAEHVYAIDISADSIDACRERARELNLEDRITFEVMDCEATTFSNEMFDVVFESGVLHHLDLPSAYQELARVVKRDGSVLCHEGLRHNPLIQLYRRRTPHLRTEWETAHILGEPEIDDALRFFGRVEKRFFHLAALAAVPFRNRSSFGRILTALEKLDGKLLSWPFLRRQAWTCVFIMSEPAIAGSAASQSLPSQ